MADYSDYKECTDCVHYELCLHQEKFLIEHNRKDLIRRYGFGLSEPEICCNFRDRSRFVELPCKVGDTVFVVEKIAEEWKIIKDHVETIGIGYYADGVNIYQFDGIKTDGYFEDFGKTVFLTREEAERALKLKEREGGA